MSALISRLRQLVGDPAGSDAAFTDQDLQDALDLRRDEVVYEPLTPLIEHTPTGTVARIHRSSRQYWESNALLQDGAATTIIPDTAEPLRGQWIINAGAEGTVYATGRVYDMYGAAVDVLEAWSARLAREYDFATDGQDFKRSQQSKALLTLAAEFRRRMDGIGNVQVAQMVRSDVV